MRTFIINLKESTDRRQYMINEMKKTNLEYEFFDAVNGKTLSNIGAIYDKDKAIKEADGELTLGEIGCAMSHLLLYKKMMDENIERALILEDDIIIEKDFNIIFEKLDHLEISNSVILLGQSSPHLKRKIYKKRMDSHYTLRRIFDSGCGTYGYIIDVAAAGKLYGFNYPIKYAADMWHTFWKFIKIYILEPYLINFDKNALSIIDSEEKRISGKKSKQAFLFFILLRKSCSLIRKIVLFFRDCLLRVLP